MLELTKLKATAPKSPSQTLETLSELSPDYAF